MEKKVQINKNNLNKKIIVNIITGLRVLGGISIIFIYLFWGLFPTAIVSIGIFLTDFIDGKLARMWHVQSFFGSLLDGLSDKLFGIISLIILSTINPIFIFVILGEILILYINIASLQRGNNVQSSIFGKVKTFVLAGSVIGSFIIYSKPIFNLNPALVSYCLAIAELVSSLFVAIDYAKRAHYQDTKRIKNNKKNRKKKSKEEILFALFDTEFYLENKDNSIKELIYK